MVSGFVASVQGKEIAGKLLWPRWEIRSEWMILFWIIAESVRRNHPVWNYSGNVGAIIEYPATAFTYVGVCARKGPYSGLDICLTETCSQTRWFCTRRPLQFSVRFLHLRTANSYGRLIGRKGLHIPFVSISLFSCRSNWLTKVDLSNRKAAFHKPSTFSAASIRALVRPRASSYRFFVLSSVSLRSHHGLI